MERRNLAVRVKQLESKLERVEEEHGVWGGVGGEVTGCPLFIRLLCPPRPSFSMKRTSCVLYNDVRACLWLRWMNS